MSPPPKITKIRREDFKDVPEWFDDLLRPLNEFISSVAGGLNRGLSRAENFDSRLRTGVEFQDQGVSVTVKHDLGRRPVAVSVAQLQITSGAALTAAWSMTWSMAGDGTDIVLSFQGLPTGRSYKVSLLLE